LNLNLFILIPKPKEIPLKVLAFCNFNSLDLLKLYPALRLIWLSGKNSAPITKCLIAFVKKDIFSLVMFPSKSLV